jgi:hypothetical protein
MNFSDVFVDSLRYPFSNIKKLLILLLLHFGTFLLIPIIMAYGYALRIIESTLKNENELPDFSNVGQLLEKGLEFIGVTLIYRIPIFIVTILIFTQVSLITVSPTMLISNPLYMITLIAIGFLVNIFYVLGLANMVQEKRFKGAFAFKRILELIKKIGWGKYLAFLVVFTIILELISSIATFLLTPFTVNMGIYTPIGYFAISFIFNAYLLAFGSRFKGLIYPLDEIKVEEDSP